MRTTTKTLPKRPHLGALGLAAALALAAAPSFAGIAKLNIDAISLTSANATYVANTGTVDQYQTFTMTALEAGGVGAGSTSSTASASNWVPFSPNVKAQSANAMAFGNTTDLTDPSTQMPAAGLFLNAQTTRGGIYGAPALPNYANANGSVGGAFSLFNDVLDPFGNPTGSVVSVDGDVTISVYYTISAASLVGSPATDYAQVLLDLAFSDYDDENYNAPGVNLVSSGFAGGDSGDVSGVMSLTLHLLAGQAGYYALTGTAISSSAVPEPGGLALASLALFALGGVRRFTRPAARKA